jgi:adenylosuccinate lyase
MLTLSPLDGRYRDSIAELVPRISEFALNRARCRVEIDWLICLAESRAIPELRQLTSGEISFLRSLADAFGQDAAAGVARFERGTEHDVKAVEYYVRARLTGTPLATVSEFVHFCATSEDINNLAYALMLKAAVTEVWLPAADALQRQILAMAQDSRDVPMLARTHGQPATPTTLGKELAVFASRLGRQLDRVAQQEYLGKFNGATGTFSAHAVAAPHADWLQISKRFVEQLGLTWNPVTTQIESHDYMHELFSDIARVNSILHNLDTDVWLYVSLGYFRQSARADTVGSSTMPHKINPILFENSEANLELSNALLRCLSDTLVTSRLQRDLTDSSMQRNIGPALGYSLVAINNTRRGLATLEVAREALGRDLANAWEVLGEAIQTMLRRHGREQSYEQVKTLMRGSRVDQAMVHEFVRGLRLPAAGEQALLELTPARYTGLAGRLVALARPRPAPAQPASSPAGSPKRQD